LYILEMHLGEQARKHCVGQQEDNHVFLLDPHRQAVRWFVRIF